MATNFLGFSKRAPFENTPNDHRGLVVLVAAMLLSFVLTITACHIFVLYHAQRKSRSGLIATIIFFSAVITMTVQCILVCFGAHYGWGQAFVLIPADALPIGLKYIYVSVFLYLFTLYLSKCSSIIFFLSLSGPQPMVIAVWVFFGLSTCWFISAMFLEAFRCGQIAPWMDITNCKSLVERAIYISVVDAFTDMCPPILSWLLVRKVNMSVARKRRIIFIFSCRLLTIPAVVAHLLLLRSQHNTLDPTLVGGWVTICGNIQMTFATIAIVLPCSKPFLAVYENERDAKLSFRATRSTTPSYQYHGSKKDHQVRMTNLSQNTNSTTSSRHPCRVTSPPTSPVVETRSTKYSSKNWPTSISEDPSGTAVSSPATDIEAADPSIDHEPLKPSSTYQYSPRLAKVSFGRTVSSSGSSIYTSPKLI